MRATGVRKVKVDSERAGQRIDNFCAMSCQGYPKGRVYRLLRRGEVRVNGGRIRAEYKLQEGDEVRIPPARVSTGGPPPPEKLAAAMLDRVIYEDKRLLVINKPTGCRSSRRQRDQPRRDRIAAARATGSQGPRPGPPH